MDESELFGGINVDSAYEKLRGKQKPLPKSSKFNVSAKERRTWEGRVYDSVLEMQMHKLLLQHFPPEYIKLQTRFLLQPAYCLDADRSKNRDVVYTSDFVLGDLADTECGPTPGPGSMVIDAKGQVLPEFVLRAKLFEYRHRKPVVVVKNSKQLLVKIETHKKIMSMDKELLAKLSGTFTIRGYRSSDGTVAEITARICGRQGYLDLVKNSIEVLDELDLSEIDMEPEILFSAREKIRASLQKKLDPEEEGAARKSTTESFEPVTPDICMVDGDPQKITVLRLEVLEQRIIESAGNAKKSKPETVARNLIEKQLPIARYLHRINLYPGKFEAVEVFG